MKHWSGRMFIFNTKQFHNESDFQIFTLIIFYVLLLQCYAVFSVAAWHAMVRRWEIADSSSISGISSAFNILPLPLHNLSTANDYVVKSDYCISREIEVR